MRLLNAALAVVMLAALSASNLTSAQETAGDAEKLFWVFLTTGKSVNEVDKKDLVQMQQAHLGNFGRLAQEGKLLCAGPMADPGNRLRGIVVLKATDMSAVDEMFEADPYVQEGFMNVEAHETVIEQGQFATKLTPAAMEELRIVLFNQPEGEDAQTTGTVDGQSDYTKKMFAEGTIRFAANFVESDQRRYVWIAAPKGNLSEVVEGSPAALSGGLSTQIIPLYLGEGSLVTEKAKSEE